MPTGQAQRWPPPREQAEQLTVNLVPHDAGKAAAAPSPATAGAASTPWGGPVIDQDPPERGDGVGAVAGSFPLGEPVPHRAGEPAGVGVLGQPGQGPGRQGQRRVHPRRCGGGCRRADPASGVPCRGHQQPPGVSSTCPRGNRPDPRRVTVSIRDHARRQIVTRWVPDVPGDGRYLPPTPVSRYARPGAEHPHD